MTRMLVTRPEPDASETAARLAALDIEPIVEPLLRYQTLPTSLPDPTGFAGIVVTSGNALRALSDRDAIARFRHLELFAVGDRTAEAARRLGFAEVQSAGGNVADLIALLADAGLAGPIFYPAARLAAADLGKALARRGIMVITTKIYDMLPAEALSAPLWTQLEQGDIGAAMFFSRRTAETFVALTKGLGNKARLGMLCLSEAVAAPLLAAHFVRVGLADHPSEEAMLGLALSFARGQNPP
jgi:uroporphyrinogen-III synthase